MQIIFNMPCYSQFPSLYPDSSKIKHLGFFVNGKTLIEENEWPGIIERINQCAGLILVNGGTNYFREILDLCRQQGKSLTAKPLWYVGDLDSTSEKSLSELKGAFSDLNIAKFLTKKAFTDLEAALNMAAIDSLASLTLFNAIGGRVDQTLGNLLYLFRLGYQNKVEIALNHQNTLRVKSEVEEGWWPVPFYETEEGAFLQINVAYEASGQFPQEGVYRYEFCQSNIVQDLQLVRHSLDFPVNFQVKSPNESLFAIAADAPYSFKTFPGQVISLLPVKGPALGVCTTGLIWELKDAELDANFFSMSNAAAGNQVTVSLRKGSLLCILNE